MFSQDIRMRNPFWMQTDDVVYYKRKSKKNLLEFREQEQCYTQLNLIYTDYKTNEKIY